MKDGYQVEMRGFRRTRYVSPTEVACCYTGRDRAIAVADRTFRSGATLPSGDAVREVLVRDSGGQVIYGRRVSSRVGR